MLSCAATATAHRISAAPKKVGYGYASEEQQVVGQGRSEAEGLTAPSGRRAGGGLTYGLRERRPAEQQAQHQRQHPAGLPPRPSAAQHLDCGLLRCEWSGHSALGTRHGSAHLTSRFTTRGRLETAAPRPSWRRWIPRASHGAWGQRPQRWVPCAGYPTHRAAPGDARSAPAAVCEPTPACANHISRQAPGRGCDRRLDRSVVRGARCDSS